MPYTAAKPDLPETADQLRARIPGWGVDLDPADRPSVPRERFDPSVADRPDLLPEQQPELHPRERSIEHARLTPVFGTTCPPHGPSGAIRRLAYRRYSEARAAHWLLLLAADRVDSTGAHLRSLATRRPDDPITPTGVLGERSHHGLSSRVGRHRADLAHQWVDPFIVVGPWVLATWAAWAGGRSVLRRWRGPTSSTTGTGRTSSASEAS